MRNRARSILFACVPLLSACDGAEISGDPPVERGADTITVMTYNIFHDGENAGHGVPAWPDRRDDVVAIIRGHAPDVVGLQEAEVWQVDWLLDQLPGYSAVARGVFADEGMSEAETVAILYRNDAFGLEDSGHFWYSESPTDPGSYGSAAFGGLIRPRMATWVRLRRDGASSGFYVFNTHLAPNEGAADAALARFKSAELMVQRAARREHPDEYFLVTGDMNMAPGAWPLDYLLGSRCAPGASCTEAPSPEFHMIDAWDARHPGAAAGTRCNAKSGARGDRVDYLMVLDPSRSEASCATGLCDPPSVLDAEIVEWGGGCPSDHLPVVATVVLP